MLNPYLPNDHQDADLLDDEYMNESNCCGGEVIMGHCSICGDSAVTRAEEAEYQFEEGETE